MRRLALALALALCALPLGIPPALAAPTVELTELPQRLELPLPPGTNRLFAVKIDGKPSAVWMATGPDADARLPLQPMSGQWVVNLGDPRVAEVTAGGSQFQIFATVSGKTGASLPVQFVAARAARVVVSLKDAEGTRLPREGWVDPARVHGLTFEWKGAGARLPVKLSAGEMRIAIAPDARAADLAVVARLRDAWRAAGTLQYIDAEGRAHTIARAVPSTLEDRARTPFRLIQRRSMDVPGSDGYLTVRLGDISGSRVPVTLTGRDGTVFFERRLLAKGDRAEFALGSMRYALVVDSLVNMMVGDDHAELHVEPADRALTPAPGGR